MFYVPSAKTRRTGTACNNIIISSNNNFRRWFNSRFIRHGQFFFLIQQHAGAYNESNLRRIRTVPEKLILSPRPQDKAPGASRSTLPQRQLMGHRDAAGRKTVVGRFREKRSERARGQVPMFAFFFISSLTRALRNRRLRVIITTALIDA